MEVGIFLIFALLPPQAASLTQDECQKLDFVPGYNFGGEGFDITTMQRKTSNIIDMDTLAGEDCECHVYENGHFEGQPRQKVPAAITTWKTRNVGSQQIVSDIYSSAFEYSHRAENYAGSSWHIGLSFDASGILGFGLSGGFQAKGSKSSMSKFVHQESSFEQSVFVEHTLEVQQYEYSLAASDIPLDRNFMHAFDKLPCSYATRNDRLAFMKFIDEFGTHVINKVTLGGRIRSVTVIHSRDTKKFDLTVRAASESMSYEASLNLWIFSASGGHSSYKHRNESEAFRKELLSILSVRRYEIVGGSSGGMSDIFFTGREAKDKYQKWVDSLKKSPDVINYSVKPIFVMLEQANPAGIKNIKEKIQSLKMATEAYLYSRRKEAEDEMCTEFCEIDCPYHGKMNEKCSCAPNKQSTEMCCPQKRCVGSVIIKDMYTKNSKYKGTWIEAMIGAQTEQTEPSRLLKWEDVLKFEDQETGKKVFLKIKNSPTRVLKECMHILDSSNSKLMCEGDLFATIEFRCESLKRAPKDVCRRSNWNMRRFFYNGTCWEQDLNTKIGISGFMTMAICFGVLLLLAGVCASIAILVKKSQAKSKENDGLLVQNEYMENYGT